MERFYRIADISFRVTCPEGQGYREDAALAPFRIQSEQWEHHLECEMADVLLPPVGNQVYHDNSRLVFARDDLQIRYDVAGEPSLINAYMRVCRQGSHSHIQVMRQPVVDHLTARMVLNAMEAEHHIVKNRGFLLHASFICRNNGAILFTAPSGTGKSTQAELWCRLRGAELINGDRAAVILHPDGVRAYGVPFSGSSGVCKNVNLPLRAIVYLSQAPRTTIAPISGFRGFRRIWEGCSVNAWNREDVAQCTQNVMDVLAAVPVFHLACTPDESAVAALEQALNEWR